MTLYERACEEYNKREKDELLKFNTYRVANRDKILEQWNDEIKKQIIKNYLKNSVFKEGELYYIRMDI